MMATSVETPVVSTLPEFILEEVALTPVPAPTWMGSPDPFRPSVW